RNHLGTFVIKNVLAADCSGTFDSQGYNLIATTAGCTLTDVQNPGTNILGQDPQLDVLANYGGVTETRALLPDSPAIDAGNCTDIDGLTVTVDQRGMTRPGGVTCDIGAYEISTASSLDSDNDGIPDVWEETY